MKAPDTPPKGVTIADVAREAGVSRTTVSHALNGRGQVDPRTRDRVHQVAARMNYRPNIRAQRLRTGRSHCVALLSSMPAAVSAGKSRLGYFTELAVGCAQAALTNGYVLSLVPPTEERSPVRELDIDGAVLLEPAAQDPLAAELTARGLPYVTIGGAPGPDNIDLHHDYVADLLLTHLVDQGARQIGIVLGSSGRESQAAFRRRYLALAREHGFPVAVLEADECGGEAVGRRAAARLLAEFPRLDALCVPVDAFASGAVVAAADSGRVIGSDLLLATRYDGLRARTATPPLTAVDLRLDEVSAAAVHVLLERIDAPRDDHGSPRALRDERSLPSLVVRASTAGHGPRS